MNGETMGEKRDGPDGVRHYIDGRGIHAGDVLELLHNGAWVVARYEGSGRAAAYWVLPDGSLRDVEADDTVRWEG